MLNGPNTLLARGHPRLARARSSPHHPHRASRTMIPANRHRFQPIMPSRVNPPEVTTEIGASGGPFSTTILVPTGALRGERRAIL